MSTITLPPRCDARPPRRFCPNWSPRWARAMHIDGSACTQIGQAMFQVLVSARRSGEGAVIDPSPPCARRLPDRPPARTFRWSGGMNAEEIQAIFFAECEESLAAAEQGLAACKEGTQDADTVNAVFRGVHSIKGGAGPSAYRASGVHPYVRDAALGRARRHRADHRTARRSSLRALDTLSDHVAAARGWARRPTTWRSRPN
jgi:hypothetical protein